MRVEKIKIISSTLMACCGLQPGRKDSLDNYEEASSGGANSRIMVKFAAAMMRELRDIDYDAFGLATKPDFKLRIGELNCFSPMLRLLVWHASLATGIESGPVIAGVVGAQKPLYDIWGNTVNVAARMDKFGVRGYIQVPEGTAKALSDERVSCTLRGVVDVKGKGLMSTYFVDLNDDLNVVERNFPEEEMENVG